MKYVTKMEFDKFVKTWRKRYENDKKSPKRINKSDMKIFTDHRTMVRIYNVFTGKSGVAKCRKGDTFDLTTGIAIAYARYNGADIPVCVKPLTEDEQYAIAVVMNDYCIEDIGTMIWYFDKMKEIINTISQSDEEELSNLSTYEFFEKIGLIK